LSSGDRARVRTTLIVREAALRDAASIAHVQRESWRTTYAGILPPAVLTQHAGRKTEAVWRRRLGPVRTAGAATFIAERDGSVVGFASCGEARQGVARLDAEIYALYVLQSQQQRGAGRALVRACARHFVRNGLFGFYLWVLKANRARMFYEAIGGEVVGERTEQLGRHDFAEVAYGWHDLTELVGGE
jgi:ribosomal protein S18 acetylase RimI-like enzyme